MQEVIPGFFQRARANRLPFERCFESQFLCMVSSRILWVLIVPNHRSLNLKGMIAIEHTACQVWAGRSVGNHPFHMAKSHYAFPIPLLPNLPIFSSASILMEASMIRGIRGTSRVASWGAGPKGCPARESKPRQIRNRSMLAAIGDNCPNR
jgi:hypothetical protein